MYGEDLYGGVISIRIDGREAAYIPPDTELPDHVAIVITIDCGPQYRFGLATVRELAPPAEKRKDQVPLPQNSGYAVGDFAKSAAIFQAEKLAVEDWRQQGYARTRIAGRDIVVDHSVRTIDADIRVKPGGFAHFGHLAV